jgi:hypothetical protein
MHAADTTSLAERMAAYHAVLEQMPGEHDGDHLANGDPSP